MSASENTHGLTNNQLAILKSVLQPFSKKIQEVALFGSRATGAYRPYSDIDLVLYGEITEREVDRLRTLFLESSLSLQVDLQLYEAIEHKLLKEHIDRVKKTLFTQTDLLL